MERNPSRHEIATTLASTGSPHAAAVAARLRSSPPPREVLLVEGDSDRVALTTLARRLGRDLAGVGVSVVVMGGASGIGNFLGAFGPGGLDVAVSGLCDAGEAPTFRRALRRVGLLGDPSTASMPAMTTGDQDLAAVGFFVCQRDLEDELIRALGVREVERVLADEGDLRSFRTVQHQPAQRGRPAADVLRRFMGTRSGRKAHYAGRLVEALDLDRLPEPLTAVLTHVAPDAG